MAVIDNYMEVTQSLIPGERNLPLDGRLVCNSTKDFPNIVRPYLGMIIFTKDDLKYWKVTKLKAKQTGVMSVKDALIDTYEEFKSGTSATEYIPGEGIEIVDDETDGSKLIRVDFNVVAPAGDFPEYFNGEGLKLNANKYFSVDFDVVAKKIDIQKFSEGENITISSAGVISAKDTLYSNGEGLSLKNNTFSVDFDIVAKKSDITGGGTTDYNVLENKPLLQTGEGVIVKKVMPGQIKVSGAGNTKFNGDYNLDNIQTSGTKRVWSKDNLHLYNDGEKWIFDNDLDNSDFYYSAVGTADPWTLKFEALLPDFGDPPTVTIAENGMHEVYVFDLDTTYIDERLGDFDALLDQINGEVI